MLGGFQLKHIIADSPLNIARHYTRNEVCLVMQNTDMVWVPIARKAAQLCRNLQYPIAIPATKRFSLLPQMYL